MLYDQQQLRADIACGRCTAVVVFVGVGGGGCGDVGGLTWGRTTPYQAKYPS
jgi:hypothetical protein